VSGSSAGLMTDALFSSSAGDGSYWGGGGGGGSPPYLKMQQSDGSGGSAWVDGCMGAWVRVMAMEVVVVVMGGGCGSGGLGRDGGSARKGTVGEWAGKE
jgi:hypothetical protein